VGVELADGQVGDPALADAIRAKLRDVLVVQAEIELLPWGSLQRSDYKSKLVQR
jgi:phenylacetate-CoA ligase